MIGAGKNGHGVVGIDFGEDLGHAQAGSALDAFGAREKDGVRLDERLEVFGGGAEVGGGDDEENEFGRKEGSRREWRWQ